MSAAPGLTECLGLSILVKVSPLSRNPVTAWSAHDLVTVAQAVESKALSDYINRVMLSESCQPTLDKGGSLNGDIKNATLLHAPSKPKAARGNVSREIAGQD